MTELTASIPPPLLRELTATLSPGSLVTEPAELPAYGRDFWDHRGTPGAVIRAGTESDVAATLRLAQRYGVPVVPRAAGTNIGAGYVPGAGSLMLDLRPLNRILGVDPERLEAVVQPGVLNGDLQHKLAPLGLCFSPDPASAPISSIGGNIAENAGGPHCLKYGVTVHHVLGLSCVLPGGEVLRLDERDPGPDFLGVMIGSEGTLGVVTEARLRLRRLPEVTGTLLAAFGTAEEASETVSAIIAAGVVPAALEFFDRGVTAQLEAFAPSGYPLEVEAILLVDVEGDAEQVGREMAVVEGLLRKSATEVRRADDEAARAAMWRGRLLAGHALAASGWSYYISDITVPRERIPQMQRAVYAVAERRGLPIGIVGHAGDGNIHPNILFHRNDPQEVAAMKAASEEIVLAALQLGGTLTGEHGVGSEKRDHMRLRFTPAEIAAMRAVKEAFDPQAILNPGILLPAPSPDEPSLPLFSAAAHEALSRRKAGAAEAWIARSEGAERAAPIAGNPATIDLPNLTVTARAETRLADLRTALAGAGLGCLLTETGDGDNLTVAGAMSDTDHRRAVRVALLGVQVTLSEGHHARFGGNVVKDVAGYDLKRLYIGSGTAFGSVREATFRVQPLP